MSGDEGGPSTPSSLQHCSCQQVWSGAHLLVMWMEEVTTEEERIQSSIGGSFSGGCMWHD